MTWWHLLVTIAAGLLVLDLLVALVLALTYGYRHDRVVEGEES